tara:strand:+ start:44 stop:388 length:345 start_codon:yes stop_codon:yes gene_type:complete
MNNQENLLTQFVHDLQGVKTEDVIAEIANSGLSDAEIVQAVKMIALSNWKYERLITKIAVVRYWLYDSLYDDFDWHLVEVPFKQGTSTIKIFDMARELISPLVRELTIYEIKES